MAIFELYLSFIAKKPMPNRQLAAFVLLCMFLMAAIITLVGTWQGFGDSYPQYVWLMILNGWIVSVAGYVLFNYKRIHKILQGASEA